jgi:hypothetical protein
MVQSTILSQLVTGVKQRLQRKSKLLSSLGEAYTICANYRPYFPTFT